MAAGDPLEALYHILPLTGCQLGEILGLRWEALDLDRGELHVVSAMKDIGGRQWMGTPKTPKSRRIVPLTAMMVESLRRHHGNQTVVRLKHSAGWNPNHLVFCTSRGTAFTQSNFRREYHIPLLQNAGLPYIRPRDNRHTNASIYLDDGTPVHEIQSLLGHTSPSTTLSIYALIMPGSRDNNRNALERALAANSGKTRLS